jgi:hypothetical protein
MALNADQIKEIVSRIFEIPISVRTKEEATELTLGVLQAYAEEEFNWDTFSAYDCYEIMNRPPFTYPMDWVVGVRDARLNSK